MLNIFSVSFNAYVQFFIREVIVGLSKIITEDKLWELLSSADQKLMESAQFCIV